MGDINIRKHELKDGSISYEYRFEIASENGRRKQYTKRGFKSKAEAKRAGIKAQQLYEHTGQVLQSADLSYADFLDIWMENDCKVDLKPATITNYQKRVRNHIKPALGSYRLRAISKDDLQKFILDMYDAGYSINTLSSITGILSKSFNYAVDNHYIVFSPAVRLKIPRNRTPVTPTRTDARDIIPPSAIKSIMKRFPETHPSHIPLRLGYECGLRIGEAFALTWEDIDLEAKTLTVNRQIQWQEDGTRSASDKMMNNGTAESGEGFWYFTNPKYNSFRKIDLSDDIVRLLREEKRRQEAMKVYYGEHYNSYSATYPLAFGGVNNPANSVPNPIEKKASGNTINFLCVRKDGTYISLRTMQHTSNVIHRDIYPDFKFHSLRHTHASILYSARLPDKYISERLGHKDCKITKIVYIHLDDTMRAEGKQAINAIFANDNDTV